MQGTDLQNEKWFQMASMRTPLPCTQREGGHRESQELESQKTVFERENIKIPKLGQPLRLSPQFQAANRPPTPPRAARFRPGPAGLPAGSQPHW